MKLAAQIPNRSTTFPAATLKIYPRPADPMAGTDHETIDHGTRGLFGSLMVYSPWSSHFSTPPASKSPSDPCQNASESSNSPSDLTDFEAESLYLPSELGHFETQTHYLPSHPASKRAKNQPFDPLWVENGVFFHHQGHQAEGKLTHRTSERSPCGSLSPSRRGIKGEGERAALSDVSLISRRATHRREQHEQRQN
ncbi:MAG: hypothetical protein RL380_260 [Verrucomicrobiota bacterium]|jgi:hypothetical protein